MSYRVRIAPSALADAEDAYLFLRERSPEFANKWYNGLLPAIYELETLPGRCPLAPESEDLGIPIRQRLYGRGGSVYRILFTIVPEEGGPNEGTVRIFHIRHGARDRLIADEWTDREQDS